jgi:hypothetical protein
MTYLSTDNRRLEYAKRFGAALQRAMTARKMRPFHLFKAVGGGYSSFMFDSWLHGRALPRLDRAIKLAEALDWPALATITREGRTGTCQRDGCTQTFITEGGKARLYCGPRCYKIAHEYGLGFAHAARKKVGGPQAELLMQAAMGRAAQDEIGELRRAVAHMCAECEPEGYCRTPACPLRGSSPLPLARANIKSVEKRMGAKTRWAFAAPGQRVTA